MTAKALRQSVLQRAIQGKLVPQDPSDEPASALLQNIEREQKNCLGKDYMDFYIIKRDDGRIYEKTGNLENDISEEVAFELPAGWEYVRLSTICALENIETSVGEELPYFDAQTLRRIKKETMVESGKIVNEADRVILVDGENSGEVFIIPHRGYMGSTFRLLKSNCNINTGFLDQILKFYQSRLRNNKTGSAIPHLNKKLFKSLIIGLPPLAEQQRIVEALDEIYPLLDEYERLEKESSRLDGEICDKLRNSILQYAIQGKLVPQDPSDEPASVLLEKIKDEKKAANDKSYVDSCIYKGADEKFYEKVGKTEKDITDEIPFDIPDSWEWTRISTYTQKVTDYVASGSFASLRENVKYYKTENYALLVKTQDFSNGFTKSLTYTDEHGYNFLNNSNLFGGELILSNVGSIGKVFIVPELNRPATLAPNAIMVRCYDSKQVPWLYNVFLSDFGKKSLLKISSATAIAKFNKTGFKTLLVPIPPIAEQQRIVEALDKAFAQIDALEVAIKNSDLA